MREPAGDATDHGDGMADPLAVYPGLTDLARFMADAVAVTDLHRRVVLWNASSETLYGIAAADALGQPIDALIDSTVVGQDVGPANPRTLTLERGAWHGRLVDLAEVGARAGQAIVVDTVLSRIHAPDGRPIGVLSVKRDVTETVRLEREVAAIGSLAGATGEARSRAAVAARALDIAVAATGATFGLIAAPRDATGSIVAARDAPDAVARLTTEIDWSTSPAIRAITPVGRVISGPIDRLPLSPAMRRAMLDAGVRVLLFVGLHRDDRLIGVLGLAWDGEDAVPPSDAGTLLMATQIARGLENARILEGIVRRAESERATTVRLRALDELTRVGSVAATIDELADRSGRLINTALGAAGTAYGLLSADGASYQTTSHVEIRPAIAAWLREQRPDVRTAFRRWRSGEGAYLEPFEPGVVPKPYIDLAREAGVTAYAAIPIRENDTVVGGIVAYFDGPVAELPLDKGALDRVATIASISLENFRLRERLVASERRYRTLFEESPEAIAVTAMDGTVVDANVAALAIFRAGREWMLGRQPFELATFDETTVRDRVARLGIGASWTVRVEGIRRDGGRFPADAQVTRVELDDEPRLIVHVRDLTEQERLQAELIQAQKMEATGQLVSGVAHELNNPLAAILGFSQLIRGDPSLPEGLRNDADLLVEEATRTRRIVQNLLDFARQRAPERRATSIRALVESVLTLQAYSLSQGLIKVEVDIPDDLPAVELDRSQMQQVLVNLTHNAVYAIREGGGGRIAIAAETVGREAEARVRITVMDDGPGVAPEHVDRLFEAFFTTKPPSDGTGLGLPVSYGIVRSHGGELRYVPPPWGRGAAFTFELPVHATVVDADVARRIDATDGMTDSMTAPAPGEPTPADSRPAPTPDVSGEPAWDPDRPRVLVVDDEASVRAFLDRALRTLGYDPVLAWSGAEALERIAEDDFAALICDQQMAGLTGIDVHEALARSYPALAARFVLTSGDVLNPTIAAFAAANRVSLLAKPFDLDTLDRTVRSAIDGSPGDQPRGYA